MTICNSIILCVHIFYTTCSATSGVTDKSKTLLDNIIFNSFEFTTLSGNITHAVSNQLIQFVILEDFITPKPPSKSNVYK